MSELSFSSGCTLAKVSVSIDAVRAVLIFFFFFYSFSWAGITVMVFAVLATGVVGNVRML